MKSSADHIIDDSYQHFFALKRIEYSKVHLSWLSGNRNSLDGHFAALLYSEKACR